MNGIQEKKMLDNAPNVSLHLGMLKRMKNKIDWENPGEVKEYYKKKAKKHYQEHKEEHKEYCKQYRFEHKEEIREKKKKYYQRPEVKVKSKEYHKQYNIKHKEERRKYKKKYRLEHKKEKKEYDKKYNIENRDKVKLREKKYGENYYKKNKIEVDLRNKKYRIENPEKINKYMREKRKNDKNFKLICYLRGRTWFILNKYLKTGKINCSKSYGIDYKAIIKHLSPLPENLSDYHNHHIKPLFTFSFVNKDGNPNLEEIKKAFAPENHKLMLVEDHRKLNHAKLLKGG